MTHENTKALMAKVQDHPTPPAKKTKNKTDFYWTSTLTWFKNKISTSMSACCLPIVFFSCLDPAHRYISILRKMCNQTRGEEGGGV